jgi:hypothetical protein
MEYSNIMIMWHWNVECAMLLEQLWNITNISYGLKYAKEDEKNDGKNLTKKAHEWLKHMTIVAHIILIYTC